MITGPLEKKEEQQEAQHLSPAIKELNTTGSCFNATIVFGTNE